MVRMSTSQARNSRIVATTSSNVSPKPDHDPGFGDLIRVELLCPLQGGLSPCVPILRLNLAEQARNSFHIVIEDIRAGVRHEPQGIRLPYKIRDEHFHGAAGNKLADATDRRGENGSSPVGQIVAIDRGDHDVTEPHLFHSPGNAFRFIGRKRLGTAVLDVAKSAGAGAHVPQQEEGGRSEAPAFGQVGAHRLFADGVQSSAAHELPHRGRRFAGGPAQPNPFRPPLRAGRLAAFGNRIRSRTGSDIPGFFSGRQCNALRGEIQSMLRRAKFGAVEFLFFDTMME